jgi:hypothetical protein
MPTDLGPALVTYNRTRYKLVSGHAVYFGRGPSDDLTRTKIELCDELPTNHTGRTCGLLLFDSVSLTVENLAARNTIHVRTARCEVRLKPGGIQVFDEPDVRLVVDTGAEKYELECTLPTVAIDPVPRQPSRGSGSTTLNPPRLSAIQLRIIEVMGRETSLDPAAPLLSNKELARSLSRSTKIITDHLDDIGDKFTRAGIKGVHGQVGNEARNRRLRIWEAARTMYDL